MVGFNRHAGSHDLIIEYDSSHQVRVQLVMKKLAFFFGVGLIVALIGFVIGWFISGATSVNRLDRVVAMSWGDGKYGPAFYGAHVYLEPQDKGYSVRARVYIGRGNDYFHDCGELGRVQTDAEAVARWGQIAWQADGLHIGSGTNQYFLPRTQMESHR